MIVNFHLTFVSSSNPDYDVIVAASEILAELGVEHPHPAARGPVEGEGYQGVGDPLVSVDLVEVVVAVPVPLGELLEVAGHSVQVGGGGGVEGGAGEGCQRLVSCGGGAWAQPAGEHGARGGESGGQRGGELHRVHREPGALIAVVREAAAATQHSLAL